MKKLLFLPFLGLLLLTSACTSNQIDLRQADVAPASRSYDQVVVGEIESGTAAAAGLAPFVRQGLLNGLRDRSGIARVVDGTAEPLPEEAVLVSGTVTEVDLGNAAARIIIGFGAGAQSISGRFDLTEADGTRLGSFSSSQSYQGGAGIGGISHLSMEELAERFGGSIAAAIARWIRGEPLQQPTQESN